MASKSAVLLTLFLLCLTSTALDLKYINTDYSFNSACQNYEITTTEDIAALEKPTADISTIKYGSLGACSWIIGKTITTQIQQPVYKETCSPPVFDSKAGNNTINCSTALQETKLVTTEKLTYVTDFNKEALTTKETKTLKYCCEIHREYIKDRGYTVEIDIIPTYYGKAYTDYAWFNSTYEYRYDIVNESYALPTWVNGTLGYNGVKIITNSWGNNNNLSQYIIPEYTIAANDTYSWPFETESGGLNYSIYQIYDKNSNSFLTNNSMIAMLHFGFNNSNKLFNSRTEAYDGLCNGANCMPTNGIKGQGFDATGADAYAELFTTDVTYYYDQIAYVLWVYPAAPNQWTSTLGNFIHTQGCGIILGYTTNQLDFECGAGNDQPFADIAEQKWYMLTFTCDGGYCYAYINDTLLTSFSKLGGQSIKNTHIANRYLLDQPLTGAKIDEVMIFSRNLTLSDVSHLVNSTLGNSEYMYENLEERVCSVEVTQNSPAQGATWNGQNVSFNFTAVGTNNTYTCSLIIDEVVNNTITGVLNNTPTIIYASSNFTNGSYDWQINCSAFSNCSAQTGEFRLTVNETIIPTTTTTTTQGGGTTTTYPDVSESIRPIEERWVIMIPCFALILSIVGFILSKNPLPSLMATILWFASSLWTVNVKNIFDFTTGARPYWVSPGNWEVGTLYITLAVIMGSWSLLIIIERVTALGIIGGKKDGESS